jgi:hypothetical protein
MPGQRFQIGVYKPQCGSSNPGFVGTSADTSFEAALKTSWTTLMQLISTVQLGSKNGASGSDRTDAAQAALLALSNSVLVSAADITNNGLTSNPYAWAGSVNWTNGLTLVQNALSSLE